MDSSFRWNDTLGFTTKAPRTSTIAAIVDVWRKRGPGLFQKVSLWLYRRWAL